MDRKIEKALVTGGAGFIGSNLVDALLREGAGVKVLDNLSTGRLENLAHVEQQIEFKKGDIRDLETVQSMCHGCDVVFHQAAVVSVPQTVEDPLMSAAVNDMGTLHVLESARIAGVKRVVLASSCAVYGDDPELPKQEHMLVRPQSPYAVQKYTSEMNAGLYNELYELETVCLRYFNVFGPRQDPTSPYSGVISIFMASAAQGRQPIIYGDGGQYRDFVFVNDVVNANLLAATADKAKGGVFNIGTGQCVTINALWSKISAMAGIDLRPLYADPRAGDILESVADIGRAQATLGYEVDYAFDDGLRLTHEWYKTNSS
jgi:nucleoside-diphosphate-sugar epimerase